MTTRSIAIAAFVNTLAAERPKAFVLILLLFLGVTVLASGVALAALLSGPIGVDMQNSFYALPVSRLTVLQVFAPVAFVSFCVFLFFVTVWDDAPGWLHSMCAARGLRYVVEVLQRPDPAARSWPFWFCAVLAVLWANWEMLVSLPIVAFVEPDTIGYLQPSAIRSSGYMLFIKAVVSMASDLKWIVPIQLNLMLISFVALGWASYRLFRSQIVGIVVSVIPALSSGLLILAPAVMSEAIFVALICFHMAAVLSVLRQLSWCGLFVAGVTLALMIVVRPNGISFLVGVPLLLIFFRNHWRRVAAMMFGPVVVVALAQSAYHDQTFGFFGLHQFGGISMAGVAAPLVRADMPTQYPHLVKELETRFESYYVDFPPFEERTYPFEMAHVASLTAVGAIFREILPAIRTHLKLPEPDIVYFEYDPQINRIAGSVAVDAIRNNPWGFIKIITSNYIANWHIALPIRVPISIYYPRNLDITREVGQQHAALLSQVTDLGEYWTSDLESRVSAVGNAGIHAIEFPRLIMGVFQLALACCAFLLSVAGVLAIIRRWGDSDHVYRAWAYVALVLQSGYGLISMGNAPFTRYTVIFDPMVILILAIGGVMAVRYVFMEPCADKTFP